MGCNLCGPAPEPWRTQKFQRNLDSHGIWQDAEGNDVRQAHFPLVLCAQEGEEDKKIDIVIKYFLASGDQTRDRLCLRTNKNKYREVGIRVTSGI